MGLCTDTVGQIVEKIYLTGGYYHKISKVSRGFFDRGIALKFIKE